MEKLNSITPTALAKEKGCAVQTIYNRINAGKLNAVKMGGVWLVLKDELYEALTVEETGGRLHRGKPDPED